MILSSRQPSQNHGLDETTILAPSPEIEAAHVPNFTFQCTGVGYVCFCIHEPSLNTLEFTCYHKLQTINAFSTQ